MPFNDYLFCHSEIDEARLTPLEFRLLAHLSRRAGNDGQIYSSVADMAEVCVLQINTIKRGLRGLLERNIVVSEQRTGKTAFRRINLPAMWIKAPVRNSTRGEKRPGSENAPTPRAKSDPGPRAKNAPQRVSKKENPKKGIQYELPILLNTTAFKEQFDRWIGHLRQKKKPPTDLAIEEQLKKCVAIGEQRAIAMIQHSIRNNWQGLFEESAQHANGNNGHKPSGLHKDQTW